LSIANFSNSPVHFSTGIEAERKCFRCIPVPRFFARAAEKRLSGKFILPRCLLWNGPEKSRARRAAT
jgi:hypothetical protein